jgi:hypothetical protein
MGSLSRGAAGSLRPVLNLATATSAGFIRS